MTPFVAGVAVGAAASDAAGAAGAGVASAGGSVFFSQAETISAAEKAAA